MRAGIRSTAIALTALASLCAAPAGASANAGHHHHRRGRAAGHRHHRRGHAATHTLRVHDSAKLKLLSADGNTLVEQGRAKGNLPGTVRVTLTLRAHTATSTFTLRVAGGSIAGSGKGSLKAGKRGYDSFGGKLTVRHGSGRYRGAHGSGGLYGSVYRVTDAMSVKVSGTLRY